MTDILDSILLVVNPLYWLEIQHYHYQHLPTVVFILCVIFLNFRIVFIVAILGHSELAFFAVRAWINMAGKMVIMGVNRNNGSPKEMDWKKGIRSKVTAKTKYSMKKASKMAHFTLNYGPTLKMGDHWFRMIGKLWNIFGDFWGE